MNATIDVLSVVCSMFALVSAGICWFITFQGGPRENNLFDRGLLLLILAVILGRR